MNVVLQNELKERQELTQLNEELTEELTEELNEVTTLNKTLEQRIRSLERETQTILKKLQREQDTNKQLRQEHAKTLADYKNKQE
jgi:phosphoglycerate-specific signal transduction histidine kinase